MESEEERRERKGDRKRVNHSTDPQYSMTTVADVDHLHLQNHLVEESPADLKRRKEDEKSICIFLNLKQNKKKFEFTSV